MISSSVPTKSFLEVQTTASQGPTQSPLVDLHPLMISHALFVAETYRLLPEIYELVWQTLYRLQSQGQMAHQSKPAAHNGRRRGPPSPDPEPAAPPYVLPHHLSPLSLDQNSLVHATHPGFQPPTIYHHMLLTIQSASSSFPNPDLHVCPAFRYQTALIRVPSPNRLRHLARMCARVSCLHVISVLF